MLIVALVLQAASPQVPQAFSILAPVADEPCVRSPAEGEVIVCGDPLPSQQLPYLEEIIPAGPVPSNPELSGTGAMAAEAAPCASIQKGCTVGFGPPIVPLLAEAMGAVKRVFAAKPDKSRRVPIPLD